jgi:hypothetical protein
MTLPGSFFFGMGKSAIRGWQFSQYTTPAPHSRSHKLPQCSQYFSSIRTLSLSLFPRFRFIGPSLKWLNENLLYGNLCPAFRFLRDSPSCGPEEKSPAPISANLREPNAGLVFLTMACRGYLVLLSFKRNWSHPVPNSGLRR